jgi:hypothetical protein
MEHQLQRKKECHVLLERSSLFLLLISVASLALSHQVTASPIVKFTINFETPSDFEVDWPNWWSAPIWNNVAVAWYLYKDTPNKDNPTYPKSPNLFEVATDVVRSGKQSAKLSLVDPNIDRATRLQVEHDWNPTADKDLWLEGWFYLPPNFPADDWTNLCRVVSERLYPVQGRYEWFQMDIIIGQWKTSRVSNTEYRLLSTINHGWVDNNKDGVNDLPTEYDVKSVDTIRFAQWFKIKMHVYRDLQQGVYTMWLNDKLQWDLHGIRTIGILPDRIAAIGEDRNGSPQAYITNGFSLYSGNVPNVRPKYLYVDDVVLSSGKSDPDSVHTPLSSLSTGIVVQLLLLPTSLNYPFSWRARPFYMLPSPEVYRRTKSSPAFFRPEC